MEKSDYKPAPFMFLQQYTNGKEFELQTAETIMLNEYMFQNQGKMPEMLG